MKRLNALMEVLHEKLPFFNSRKFYLVFSVSLLFNPIAVWFQTIEAWAATSTEGLSVVTFATMLLLQSITIGYSIKIKEPVILLAMATSAIGTIGILLALALR